MELRTHKKSSDYESEDSSSSKPSQTSDEVNAVFSEHPEKTSTEGSLVVDMALTGKKPLRTQLITEENIERKETNPIKSGKVNTKMLSKSTRQRRDEHQGQKNAVATEDDMQNHQEKKSKNSTASKFLLLCSITFHHAERKLVII